MPGISSYRKLYFKSTGKMFTRTPEAYKPWAVPKVYAPMACDQGLCYIYVKEFHSYLSNAGFFTPPAMMNIMVV